MNPPKVFISATSGDLRSARQIVKEALLTMNCHPVEQSNFEPDARTLEKLDRQKLEDCQALIHLVGFRYGAEPSLRPPDTPRRSYTQMEYHEGRRLQVERGDDYFRVYVFLCPENFPFDPEPDTESAELRALQLAHRQIIVSGSHRYESPHCKEELGTRIHALREEALSLRQQQIEVRQEARKSHKTLLFVMLLILGILAGVHTGIRTIIKGQKIDIVKIKNHLRESSDYKLAEDRAAAAKETKSDDRQRLKDAAEVAHLSRLSRIDDLAASFALLEGKTDVTDELKELRRILQEEGVDKALAHAERQKPAILKAVAAADAAHLEQKRARLQPLLQVAGIQAAKGQTANARASYQDLLKMDPQWSEASCAFAWFLHDQSIYSLNHKTLNSSLSDAEECNKLTEGMLASDSTNPSLLLLSAVALDQLGDIAYIEKNYELAWQHYLRSSKSLNLIPDKSVTFATSEEKVINSKNIATTAKEQKKWEDAWAAIKNARTNLILLASLGIDATQKQRAGYLTALIDDLDGDLHRAAPNPDLVMALAAYQRAEIGYEDLLQVTPNDIKIMREKSVALGKLGDLYFRADRLTDARDKYGQSRDVRQKLVSLAPENLGFRDTLAISLNKMCKVDVMEGNWDAARRSIDEAILITKELWGVDNANTTWALNLVRHLELRGDLSHHEGHPEKAPTDYIEAIDIVRKLSSQHQNEVHFFLLAASLNNKLGEAQKASHDISAAANSFRSGVEHAERAEKIGALATDSEPIKSLLKSNLEQLGEPRR